mgnify:CR=1 FL=1
MAAKNARTQKQSVAPRIAEKPVGGGEAAPGVGAEIQVDPGAIDDGPNPGRSRRPWKGTANPLPAFDDNKVLMALADKLIAEVNRRRADAVPADVQASARSLRKWRAQ